MIWFIIALLPFVVYAPVRDGEFIFDDWAIEHEPTLAFVRTGNVREWFRIQLWPFSGFRQLTWLSFLLNRKMVSGKTDAEVMERFRFAAHLTSIALHSVNSLLVGSIGGWLAGLIFALHPLASGAVSYLSARPSVLSSTFTLAAVSFSLHGHAITAAIFLPLAVLAKEDMAILPVLLTVLAPHYWWLYFAPVAYFTAIRFKHIRALITPNETGAQEWEANGVPIRKGLNFYLTTLTEHLFRLPAWMFGFWLNPDPDCYEEVPIAAALWAVIVWPFMIATGSSTALWMMFLSPLALYLIIQTPDIVMDYRAYFTLAGMSLILAKWAMLAPSWILWGGLALAAAYTALRAWYYSTRIGYWAWVTLLSPNKARGWIQLGQAYREDDPPSFYHAEQAYLDGLKSAPGCAILYQHMAWLREREGKLEEAWTFLMKGLSACPRSVHSWYSLGIIEEKLGHEDDALKAFTRAIELKPTHELSQFHVGKLKLGDPEAIPYLREAARLRPDIDEFQQVLAVACFVAGEDPGPACPFRVQATPVC